MNIDEKVEMLKTYISVNVAPILLEGVPVNYLKEVIAVPANCSKELLYGSYEEDEFVAPNWYKEIESKKNAKSNILVIDDISKISKDEQIKFCELLKYRKISTFELPKNCTIIVLAEKVNSETISSEIYSLVAHI